jgi:hypothetical protein
MAMRRSGSLPGFAGREPGLARSHRVHHAPRAWFANGMRPSGERRDTAAMRLAAIALVIPMLATATADGYPTLHVAARVGAQHTKVDKDDGAPDGWGARYEISAGVQPTELISFWGVAAMSSYGDPGLYDGVTRMRYRIDVSDEWLGLRILLHPHPALFLGVGYTKVYTSETSDLGSDSLENTSWEFTGGVNVLATAHGSLQAALTFGYYERLSNLEHVQFLSLGAGWQF